MRPMAMKSQAGPKQHRLAPIEEVTAVQFQQVSEPDYLAILVQLQDTYMLPYVHMLIYRGTVSMERGGGGGGWGGGGGKEAISSNKQQVRGTK